MLQVTRHVTGSKIQRSRSTPKLQFAPEINTAATEKYTDCLFWLFWFGYRSAKLALWLKKNNSFYLTDAHLDSFTKTRIDFSTSKWVGCDSSLFFKKAFTYISFRRLKRTHLNQASAENSALKKNRILKLVAVLPKFQGQPSYRCFFWYSVKWLGI